MGRGQSGQSVLESGMLGCGVRSCDLVSLLCLQIRSFAWVGNWVACVAACEQGRSTA